MWIHWNDGAGENGRRQMMVATTMTTITYEDEAEHFGLLIQYWWFPHINSYVYNSNMNLWKLVLLLTWMNDSVDNILALLHSYKYDG